MTTIEEFASKYSDGNEQPIQGIIDEWIHEKEVDDFLSASVGSGVLLGDFLVGDGLQDQISPELFNGFKALMGEKADSFEEIRSILMEKLNDGDSAVRGFISKIQGQIGENVFLENAGDYAHLAESGSQEGFDVVVHPPGEATQWIQVKTYSDANHVMSHIRKVQEKVDAGAILDHGEVVNKIDFAVPENIFTEVTEKTKAAGFDIDILKIPMTSDEAREVVSEGVSNIGPEAMSQFFGELLVGSLTSTAFHAMANGFLVYKGAKDRSDWLGDTALASAISTGGLAAAFTTEALFHKLAASAAFMGGAATMVSSMAVGISARMYLKRIADRRKVVTRLADDNAELRELSTQLKGV